MIADTVERPNARRAAVRVLLAYWIAAKRAKGEGEGSEGAS